MAEPTPLPRDDRFMTGGSLRTDRIDGLLDDYRQLVHRVRGCLNGVVLNAALLKRLPPGTPRADECERTVKDQLARAAGVLDDFERYLQVGILAVERVPAASLHARLLRSLPAGDRVEVDASPDLPAVDVDPPAVVETLRTLVQRCRSSSSGDAAVSMRVEAADHGVAWKVSASTAPPDPARSENPFQLYHGRDDDEKFSSRMGRARRVARLLGGWLELDGAEPVAFRLWLPAAEEGA